MFYCDLWKRLPWKTALDCLVCLRAKGKLASILNVMLRKYRTVKFVSLLNLLKEIKINGYFIEKCTIFKAFFKPWIEAVVPLGIWLLSRQNYPAVANLFLVDTVEDTFKMVISTLFLEREVIVLFGRVYPVYESLI